MKIEESKWIIEKKEKQIKLKNAILIAGLPGIGNVGKISADFLVDDLKAKEIYKINSWEFPHSVFINEDSTLELPSVFIHVLKAGTKSPRDLIFVTGDVQPMEERASYAFCDKILTIAKELGCSEIITIGGIGLPGEPKKPKIYGVTTDNKTKKAWQKLSKSIHFKGNKAATIIGAAGLLLGLGKHKGFKGISLLCETVGHPYHLGLREASAILKVLKTALKLKINLNRLEKEIKKEEIAKIEQAKETHENILMKKFKRFAGETGDISYIG